MFFVTGRVVAATADNSVGRCEMDSGANPAGSAGSATYSDGTAEAQPANVKPASATSRSDRHKYR